MRGKQLAIVLALLVAFGGVALFLQRRNAASWSETATSSDAKILNFPLNDVTQVTIKGSGAELNLVKKDEWKVKERADYRADFDKVSALIRKLWELRPVQDVKIGPAQLGRLQLIESGQDANSGILLDLKGAGDKRLAALLLGKKHFRNSGQSFGESGGIPAGRYVKAEDGSTRVFLISETLDEVQAKPEQWLNRDFIKVENPKSITIAGATAGMNWKVARDSASAPWKLLDAKRGEELDSAKVQSIASSFSSATFTDVLAPDTAVAQTGLDKPASARIETFDNFVYELRIGKAMAENYPVLVSVKAELTKERTPAPDEKAEDKTKLDEEFQARQKILTDKLAKEQTLENRPYLIAKTTIDQLLKDRSALMVEKKASPSPATAASPAGAKKAPVTSSPAAAPSKVGSPKQSPASPRPQPECEE